MQRARWPIKDLDDFPTTNTQHSSQSVYIYLIWEYLEGDQHKKLYIMQMCEDGEVKYLVVATPDVGDLLEVREYIPFVH